MSSFLISVDMPSALQPALIRGLPDGVRVLHRETHLGGALYFLIAPDGRALLDLMAFYMPRRASDREVDLFIDENVREIAASPRCCKLVFLGSRIVGAAGSWVEATRLARAAAGGRVSEKVSEAPNAFHFAPERTS